MGPILHHARVSAVSVAHQTILRREETVLCHDGCVEQPTVWKRKYNVPVAYPTQTDPHVVPVCCFNNETDNIQIAWEYHEPERCRQRLEPVLQGACDRDS